MIPFYNRRMNVLRTQADRFADLPGFAWTPRYLEWRDLRIHYVDEGPRDARVLLAHRGEA